MTDRKKQPEFITSKIVDIENIPVHYLSNTVPYFVINAGIQELVKIDFLFNAGTVFNQNPLVADTVNSLIDAGTKKYLSAQIAEKIDFYGAFLELNVGKHFSQITLYTLNKYFKETLTIVEELIFGAVFPKEEVEIFLQNKLQSYYISRQKTEVLSQEILEETIFGLEHPYGRQINEDDLKTLDYETLKVFYSKYYKLENLKILISGKVENIHIELLDKFFGKVKFNKKGSHKNGFKVDLNENHKIYKAVEGAVQSSIRIGKQTINKTHPDFYNLNITSIILGGYFGSRLMKNIREDKGFTYGIYAGINSFTNAGMFSISAESGKDVFKKAIKEIYKELNILRTTYVLEDELKRVKNYLIGTFAKTFDGPFSTSDAFLSLMTYDLNFDFYQKYFLTIQSITPELIKQTANTYLNENSMCEIVAGVK